MAMSYKEVPRGLPKEESQKYAAGIELVGDFVDSLQKQGLLPRRFAETVESITSQVGSSESLPSRLIPTPFEIQVPGESEKIYAETRKAVEATGAFITSIRPLTMEDLLREDREREQKGEPRRLGYVNDSKTVLATLLGKWKFSLAQMQ